MRRPDVSNVWPPILDQFKRRKKKKGEEATHLNSRKPKHPVHEYKLPTRQQRLLVWIPRLHIQRRKIKCDDDDETGERGASDAEDSEDHDSGRCR